MARTVVKYVTLLHQHYLLYDPYFSVRLKALVFGDIELRLFRNFERLCSLEPPAS